MNTWLRYPEGTKLVLRIFQVTGRSSYHIKVDLQDETSGQVVTRYGQSNFTYAKTDGEKLSLTMTGDISIESYKYKINKRACNQSPSDCYYQKVKQKTTLQALTLSGQKEDLVVKETWKECVAFPDNSSNATEIVCEIQQEQIKGSLLMESSLSAKPITVQPGNKLVISTTNSSSAYIQLNGDYTVTVLSFEVNKNQPTFNSRKIKSWNLQGGKLILSTDDGGKLTYSKTQEYDGVSRVMGEYVSAETKKTIAGAMKVDKEIDLSSATIAEMSGFYKAVAVDTLSGYGYNVGYAFNSDGFGGFEYHSGYSVDPQKTAWAWELVGGEIVAKQYINQPVNNGGLIKDEEKLKNCIAGGLQAAAPTCAVFTERSYKVIAQDGNRYTMLRTLKAYNPGKRVPKSQSLSIWVFYKQ